jgi:hypothetical protein
MAEMPQGHSTIERLIKGPDGHKMLDYMTHAKGGRELAKMLSKDGAGNFEQPTGKIYTVDELIKELRTRHTEAHAAQKTAKR